MKNYFCTREHLLLPIISKIFIHNTIQKTKRRGAKTQRENSKIKPLLFVVSASLRLCFDIYFFNGALQHERVAQGWQDRISVNHQGFYSK